MSLLKIIIDSDFESEPGTGIPIGNLTSQFFANLYLNELDKFIKHKLKVKYYLRYMDDFLILDFDKKKLQEIKNQIENFLEEKLKLKFHPKKANVFLVNKEIEFLGYKVFKDYMLLRKSSVKRFLKRLKLNENRLASDLMTKERFFKSIESWLAYAKFGKSFGLRKNILC